MRFKRSRVSAGHTVRTSSFVKACRMLFFAAGVAFLSLAQPFPAFPFEGPLWNKSQFPLFLPVASPYLEKAAIEDSFSVRFSYSSIFLTGNTPTWTVYADMEMSDVTFQYRKKIGNLLEVGIDVPVLVYTSGFLDGFLNSYHDAFGFSDYGRPSVPNNQFRYEARQNGALVIKGQNGSVGLGDVRLTVKKPLLYDDPAVSIRADIELPTGDAKRGYGNESIDVGIALLAEKRLGEKVKAYLNLGAVFPGDYKGYETVSLREFVYGGAAVEAIPWEHWSFVGQISFQGSPWPTTGISQVDGVAVLLTLGGRYVWGQNSLEVAFSEDLNKSGAPDFTMAFSFKRRF